MQDIVPKNKKTIRRVSLSDTRIKNPAPESVKEVHDLKKATVSRKTSVDEIKSQHKDIGEGAHTYKEPVFEDTPRHTFDSGYEKQSFSKTLYKNRRKIIIGGSIGLAIVLFVVISNIFHGATLTLTPRSLSQNIQSDYVAKKNVGEGLVYDVITLKQIHGETVKATGEKQIDKKATGTIVIYNNYNSSSQRLIKNTRFATPEGLIFRITDSVTVPGKKGSVPGSIEATIVADETGDIYNVGLKDFTIPGFKGDPRYATFYGRSKTPLAGGFSGVQKVVAETDRAKAKSNIETKISSDLLARAFKDIPADKVYFKDAYVIDFVTLPEESPSAGEVTIQEEGTISVVVFDQKNLGRIVANSEIKSYNGLPVVITNPKDITFKPKSDFKPSQSESIAFTLSGKASFEWLYDENSLKQDLLGKSRAAIPAVLQKYPTIEKADISLRPFWTRTFPDSVDDIVIKKSI